MVKTKIIKPHWDLIIERILDGQCVPFLGAAANVSSGGYNGLPLGSAVAQELVQKIDFNGKDPNNLARVALEYQFWLDRPKLIKDLKTILRDSDRDPSPLLKTLAKLPFKLFITTNYDRLLEKALNDAGRDFQTIVQPTKGFEDIKQKWFDQLETYNGRLIYKIHGTLLDNGKVLSPDELNSEELSPIITEDDYIEFLAVEKYPNKISVPNMITRRITPSTLLFLGYSLEDWDFRTIYKGVIERLNRNEKCKSFAIQQNPSEFWVEFWEKIGVIIYDVDIYEFAKELEERYRKEYPWLFSWDYVPEKNWRLIEFLKQNFGIDWVKTAKIEKIDDDKTIRVFTEKNSLSLIHNEEKNKVNLKIDDGRTDEFIMKMENGKLNIYPRIN